MSNPIIDKTNRYIANTYARAPFALVQGQGMFVTDSDGKQYLDFGSGIAVNSLGHADAEVVAAVAEQVGQLSHICNLYYSEPQADLAEMLCNLSFANKVFFTNSGGEAIEAAIKFSRKYARATYGPGKSEMVAFTNAFHGRTAGSLALTPREKYQAPFRPLMPDVRIARFNDIAAAEKVIGPETVAVFVEPVQGEGGITSVTPDFLAALRDLCNRFDALLVFDEIQCGMGRTGTLWAYEHFDIQPDIMTVAKALGGGLPIGAALMTEAVAGAMQFGEHGSTFAGGPVVCRAAQVVLGRISDPAFLAHVRSTGSRLMERLGELHSPHIKEVRGLGLMIGVEMDIEVAPLIAKGFERGVLMLNAGPNILRLLPPLIAEDTHVDQFVTVLEHILLEMTA